MMNTQPLVNVNIDYHSTDLIMNDATTDMHFYDIKAPLMFCCRSVTGELNRFLCRKVK